MVSPWLRYHYINFAGQSIMHCYAPIWEIRLRATAINCYPKNHQCWRTSIHVMKWLSYSAVKPGSALKSRSKVIFTDGILRDESIFSIIEWSVNKRWTLQRSIMQNTIMYLVRSHFETTQNICSWRTRRCDGATQIIGDLGRILEYDSEPAKKIGKLSMTIICHQVACYSLFQITVDIIGRWPVTASPGEIAVLYQITYNKRIIPRLSPVIVDGTSRWNWCPHYK